jgi:hypothetical protein
MNGLPECADEPDAIDNHGIASEHVEQQNALEHLCQIEWHFHCDFRIFAADES